VVTTDGVGHDRAAHYLVVDKALADADDALPVEGAPLVRAFLELTSKL
jgi:hypothetical protein